MKEICNDVWEEAVRISPADAPITIVTHNWVNGVDPEKRLQEIAENDAFIEWYYQNVYLPNKEKEEQKAAEEAERLAAEQWLADHTAATEESIRLAKEKEEAKAEAAKKAAALDAKLAKMEAQTSSSNVVTQTSAAKALYKSSIPDEPTPTPDGEGGFFSNLWNGFLGILGIGSNNQATSTSTQEPTKTATSTPIPTKTGTPTITSTPTPTIPLGVQYEKEIHNDEINVLRACYTFLQNAYNGTTPTPTLTPTSTSTKEPIVGATEVTPTPIKKDAQMFADLYYGEDLFIYYTKKVVDDQTVYNCEYVGDKNLTAQQIKDDFEQNFTFMQGNCANYVNTILKKTGLDLEEKYGTSILYPNVKMSAPAMTQALVVEEKWTIESVTMDNLAEKATTDKVGCVVAFSLEDIDTTLFSKNIVGINTPSPTSTGTTTPEVTSTPTSIPDPTSSDGLFSQVRHVGYITDVAEGDITYADNSSSDFYDQLMDENIQMDQLSNDYKSLNQRMTDKPEYSVYIICPPVE